MLLSSVSYGKAQPEWKASGCIGPVCWDQSCLVGRTVCANLVVTVGKRLGQKSASASRPRQCGQPLRSRGRFFLLKLPAMCMALFFFLGSIVCFSPFLSSSASPFSSSSTFSFLYPYPLFFIPSFILFITTPEQSQCIVNSWGISVNSSYPFLPLLFSLCPFPLLA